MPVEKESLIQMIGKCRYERNVDDQIYLLNEINESLPRRKRVRFPSLMTNDYVSRALDIIEGQLFDARAA